MFFLALSCLQGRPMRDALESLLRLRPDGIQLTPGNQPSPDFEQSLRQTKHRKHHGFSPTRWKQAVWRDDGACAVISDSVHAPLMKDPAAATFLDRPNELLPVLETMYPGYALGSGQALDDAMNRSLRLAVDISHVFLQRHAGVIGEATWARLQDYEHIAEVHVSRNDGRSDAHLPLTADTFGLEWALARLRAGTPVILESYFHRLPEPARQAQCALFEEARA